MKRLILIYTLMLFSICSFATVYSVASPDGSIKADVFVVGGEVKYSLTVDGRDVVGPSAIAIDLRDGSSAFSVRKTRSQKINAEYETVAYKKNRVVDNCNELRLIGKTKSLVLRAYNNGFAYRWELNKPCVVVSETASFDFNGHTDAVLSYVNNKRVSDADMKASRELQLHTSHENVARFGSISGLDPDYLTFMPSLVKIKGISLCILESSLVNYPGMYLRKKSDDALIGDFPAYPRQTTLGGHNGLQLSVTEREDYIAKFDDGDMVLPWRIIAVAREDKELIENDLAYLLAPEQAEDIDFSFVKPGKVAWDWWADWNLYDVDFKAGINNDTYKYYIDFASEYGIEYVILDEGWSTKYALDLFDVVPEIDIPMLVEYASSRNVGLILWAGYYPFEKDMEKVCEYYSKLGIKGFKVDFMDRDDQVMVDFHRRAAAMTAKYGLMIDFHGTSKPAGIQRQYPNVVNFEAVHGLEQMKWRSKDTDQVRYDVTIPFTRLVAGPADYTQGAMRNASKSNYYPCSTEPMSQGTRCHQLAEYIVFDSPLTMLCDSPSNYMREREYTQFLTSLPTVWDDTVALKGEVGEYVCVARRSGSDWYVGALTNWTGRNISLRLDFLPEGSHDVTIYKDGPNANKASRDYVIEKRSNVQASDSLNLNMAQGGGFLVKIQKR